MSNRKRVGGERLAPMVVRKGTKKSLRRILRAGAFESEAAFRRFALYLAIRREEKKLDALMAERALGRGKED